MYKVKIQEKNLPYLNLKKNITAQDVGKSVVAIGTPKGFEFSLSDGIISQIRKTGNGVLIIQTNAQINPGSSGGPLISSDGEVVGINTFKYSGAEGMGFAISSVYILNWLNKEWSNEY